jgi:2,4-dienoyl-CoA reductase-like NADH-dependent reductase (Old Yellow Enzyme family)
MKLFDPITIGGIEIRNRIVMAPMTSRFANVDGFATEQGIHYYSARARGGVGLVIVEMTGIDPAGSHRERELAIHDDKYIPGFRRLVENVKAAGANIAIQLAHGGAQSLSSVTGLESVAPSKIPYTVHEKVTETHVPKELSVEEINHLVGRFSEAAERAKRSGFDMIEVHAAHGYLIYQFLSPLKNKRKDEYGGDLEGRAKFAIEIVEAIKGNVPDLPVIFRISADEYAEGGFSVEDSKKVCKMLERVGVDAIHVSAGSYLSPYPYMVPPMMSSAGCFLHLAEAVKGVVSVPVKTDMVAVGRQLIADPEWPNKVREGRLDEVRKCLSCNYCLEAMRDGACVECASNVEVGTEWLRGSAAN